MTRAARQLEVVLVAERAHRLIVGVADDEHRPGTWLSAVATLLQDGR